MAGLGERRTVRKRLRAFPLSSNRENALSFCFTQFRTRYALLLELLR
jgi:hypothetical protein